MIDENIQLIAQQFDDTVQFLLRTQQADGSIPWFEGGHLDPWDHTEAAMGLSIGGEYDAAKRAYAWLKQNQLDDGSWWAAYRDSMPDKTMKDARRETNFVAYIATGIWHHYLITQDQEFLRDNWQMVERAIDFVVALQTEHGDIHWAVDITGEPMRDALITGCSSICKSLECAINIAEVLQQSKPEWRSAREKLVTALLEKPERFDRTWESKARYSMDWFYPILTGVINDKEKALERLELRWGEFVENGLGCRCVSDQPWVTIAESCELVLALVAAGEAPRGEMIFKWLQQWRLDDGSYWTGYQFAEDVLWPDEKPTWTAAAVLLAADALLKKTPAATLFTSVNLPVA